MEVKRRNSQSDLERLHAEQASAWIERLRHASPDDKAEFVAWLKESPRNVSDILFMLALDQSLDNLDARRLHDTTTLIGEVNNKVLAFPAHQRPGRIDLVRSRPLRWAVVSIAVLVAFGGVFLIQDRVGWKEYRTATSEQRAFVLADGSVIHLNTRSRIAVRLSSGKREVRLVEGEALFQVHHDASRSFHVYTDNAQIEDVGTQFNVRNRSGETVVAVLEGRVNVVAVTRGSAATTNRSLHRMIPKDPGNNSAAPETYALSANQEAAISPAGSVSIRAAVDISDAVAWRGRRLVFRQDSLGRIAEEFNRYNTRTIRVAGADVAKRVYTGVFDANDTDSLLQVLARDKDLSVVESENEIVIRSRLQQGDFVGAGLSADSASSP
jgi:transmembrane sensor